MSLLCKDKLSIKASKDIKVYKILAQAIYDNTEGGLHQRELYTPYYGVRVMIHQPIRASNPSTCLKKEKDYYPCRDEGIDVFTSEESAKKYIDYMLLNKYKSMDFIGIYTDYLVIAESTVPKGILYWQVGTSISAKIIIPKNIIYEKEYVAAK